MTLKIKLICDSLCDIPKEIQDKEYLDVVPLTIIFNDKEYKDGVDISKEEYYEILKNSKEIPKTSQATYIQFSEIFNKYILIRNITQFRPDNFVDSYNILKMTFKIKNIESDGTITNQCKKDCQIYDMGQGKAFLTDLGYKNIMTIK